MGGGNLASNSKKKGFAISGILYPLLILTLFLVVQMLFMLQTRKNVLDKARTELADTVNEANQIYTNEELSALIQEQAKQIANQQSLIDANKNTINGLQTEVNQLKNKIYSDPIGEYNLFIGNYYTTSATETEFHIAYFPIVGVKLKFGEGNYRYRLCHEFTSSAKQGTYAYIHFITSGKKVTMESTLWGANENAMFIDCQDIDASMVSDEHSILSANVDSPWGLRIYRSYLQVYRQD